MKEPCTSSGVWKQFFTLLRQYSADKMENQLTDHGVTAFIEDFVGTLRPRDCTSNKYEIFKIKIYSVITTISLKHQRRNINSFYEHLQRKNRGMVIKKSLESVMIQIINHGIKVNKKSSNGYDSFYRKLSNDNGNPNLRQQHLGINT